MLPSLKKKNDSASSLVPHWHPDFRNYERLPDIKVVRTAFFVNGVAVGIFLALILFFAKREWQVYAINRQADDWQRQIDRDKKGSEQSVALYKKFQAEEASVIEVDAFIKSKPIFSELLLHLAQTLPTNLAFDNFEVRNVGLSLRGTVRGAPDQATGYASAYIDQLRNDPFISVQFDDVSLKGLTRNPSNNRVVIELFLKFKPAALKEGKRL